MNADAITQQPDDRRARGMRFDPTVNLGHILTFVAMLAGVMTSYSLLDKRVGVLEEKASSGVVQSAERQQEQKESLREIKADIKDLQRSVNEISRAVGGMKGLK